MLRCPHCTRIYDSHVERCPRHGALEPCDAVRLCDALEHDRSTRSPSEVLALIDAALAADSAGGTQLSPKQLYVAKGATLAFAGYAGLPPADALDDALHDPLDVARKSEREREAYRVAALAFELFAGSPAFVAKNAKAVVVRKRLEAPPSLAAVRPDLPASVSALVSSALDDRGASPDAAAFVAALRAAVASSQPAFAEAALAAPSPAMGAPIRASAPTAIAPFGAQSAGPPAPLAAPAPARGSGGVIAIVVVAVLLAAFAGSAIFFVSGRSSPSRVGHEELHQSSAADQPAMPMQTAQGASATVAPSTPIGVTTPTPTPTPTSPSNGPTTRTTVTGQSSPNAADIPNQPGTRRQVRRPGGGGRDDGTASDSLTPAPLEPPAPAHGTSLSSNDTPRPATTEPDPQHRSAGGAGAPTRREGTTNTVDPPAPGRSEPASVEAPTSKAPWLAGVAISAALILCALFLWRRARNSARALAPSSNAPEAPATRAALVATRNSITDSVQLPHPAYSQTIPAAGLANSGGAVDALARTEVVDASVPGGARSSAATQRQPAEFRPFSIGAYQCFEQLGEGAMGIVYKARHEASDRLCAVKVLVPDLAERPDAAAQFRREAALAASVQHPNTVVVYDFGELDGGLLYLVMELLDGRTLEALMRERRPSKLEALELVRQLSDGLDALHSAGIVHQDLKPQNVMVIDENKSRPVVKIVDFGLARLVGADPIEAPSGMRRISGTPLYMAPEQARADDRIGPSADLFALAVVAYEVLAGTAPFELDGRTVSQVVLERASGHFRAKPTGRAELDALFEHGLAADPSLRPSSARDFFAKMSAAVAA
ncbi:MAG: protein kinase [Myxococcales bacterium]|nr:protein kinase [Myxococcales bacterium]